MDVAAVRNELRFGTGDALQRQRLLIMLSIAGLLDFVPISLYQTGVINKIPDLPLKGLDSNKVNAAEDAYQMGGPDGPISMLAYAGVMVLASWKGSGKSGRTPVHDLALGALVAGNAAGALYYLGNMVFKQQKACIYCIAGAAVNFASAIVVAPLMRNALRKLWR